MQTDRLHLFKGVLLTLVKDKHRDFVKNMGLDEVDDDR
jgi:hypothetical protein